MARLDLNTSFIPPVKAKFGKQHIIDVKEAKGSQPISQCYKNWKDVEGNSTKNNGELYQLLLKKSKPLN
ncbi:MAG: hypothetical protein WAO74_03175 [Polaribacter sp.]|uniref:hypothetical protein n=1 Tax=Polaribacter sp. TaxID=1920175 RepID=UPI003BB1D49A